MRNLERIIAKVKTLDTQHMSFDSQGKLYIKNTRIDLTNSPEKTTLPIISKPSFLAPLLHPEDRLVRKNIHTWVLELLTFTKAWQETTEHDYKHLAMLFNLSSFLHLAIGNINNAERLCRKQIDFFLQQSKKEYTLLKYIVQPWINLGRLDRLKGNYELALTKFEILKNLLKPNSIVDRDIFHVDAAYLLASIGMDKEVQQVIKTCSLIEPIKTSLATRAYSETLNKIESIRHEKENVTYASFFDEVEIIVHAGLGKVAEAKRICILALEHVPPHLLHIFLLRQAEIALLENNTTASELLVTIVKFIMYLEPLNIDANHVFFSLKVAQLLLKNGHTSLAKNVYQKAFQLAQHMGDELYIIESLEGLQKITQENLYKRLLYNYVSNSSYQQILQRYPDMIKAKMITNINDKCKQLFNRLMAL